MKKIISRIILVLSFAPYVFTLIYGIYSMANGSDKLNINIYKYSDSNNNYCKHSRKQ